MITFPSLPLFVATEAAPAAATAADQPQGGPLFAEFLANAGGNPGAAASGKALPPPGPELPLPDGTTPPPLAAAQAMPGVTQAPANAARAMHAVTQAPANAMLPAGILAEVSGETLETAADFPAAEPAETSAATLVARATAATPAPEADVVTLPLAAGGQPPVATDDTDALPAARAPVSAMASPLAPVPATPPAPAPGSLPAPPGVALADLAMPPAAAEVGAARPDSLLPALPTTPAAQGEPSALSMPSTAAVAPDAALQSPPRPQLPQSLPLQHAPQDPGFSGELANRLQVFARNGVQEATLQLHPAELGRLQVSITTDGDQARVVFVADNAAARDAIEQSMPRLRELLAQSGLQLAHSDVSGQSQAGGQRGNSPAGTTGFQDPDSGLTLAAVDAPSAAGSAAGTYLVDYYI